MLSHQLTQSKSLRSSDSLISWAIFILYLVVAGLAITHHELWGDELHSWNIAKGSKSFSDLISNTKYEGHPPLWYITLWMVSKFTHDVRSIQLVQFLIASSSSFLVIFYAPFPRFIKFLLPFGYFFLFEYGIISRNYAIGVLLALLICLVIRKESKFKLYSYYGLLLLLANVHLVALLLAVSIHFYFLLLQLEIGKKRIQLFPHFLLGLVIFASSFYFISPPSESELNVDFWLKRWSIHNITAIIQLPLRAFLPIPAVWNFHFWNSEFLIEAKDKYSLLRFINPVIDLAILGLILLILRKDKKSLGLFFFNLLLSFITTIAVFPLTSERYSGFIFIGFVIAYWLYCYERRVDKRWNWIINSLFIVQTIAGLFVFSKDMRLPFSNGYKANELLGQVPANERVVTDYWALNVVSAYTDKAFYCIDMQKQMSFIMWGSDMVEMQKKTNRYCEGIYNYVKKESINKIYMISTASPTVLFQTDSKLSTCCRIILIDKREGAIEKGGNLYLYQIDSVTQ